MLPLTLRQIADLTGAALKGDPDLLITALNDLASASPTELSFFTSSSSRTLLHATQAGALFIRKEDIPKEAEKNYLVVDDPSQAFQSLAEKLIHPAESAFKGIHPTALIAPHVLLEENVTIGPYAIIDQGAKIGKNSFIGASCFIGAQVKIGPNCRIHPRAVLLERTEVGARTIIHSGAVIGADGFGFNATEKGIEKIAQLGYVLIEEDVEIGANTTIDRARFGTTRIGKGSKLDNLIQIGHNVQIGHYNIIVAQTGIAGSATTGAYVVMGGQVGVNGHITIANNTRIAALSAVSKSIGPGDFKGNPAQPLQAYNRMAVFLKNIEKLVIRIEELERRTSKI